MRHRVIQIWTEDDAGRQVRHSHPFRRLPEPRPNVRRGQRQRRQQDTPTELYIKYKPAPYQKIHQQTCNPKEVEVKGPKTRGRQISTKDVSSINSTPPRSWDPKGAITKLQFA